jgi:hypothetical protein
MAPIIFIIFSIYFYIKNIFIIFAKKIIRLGTRTGTSNKRSCSASTTPFSLPFIASVAILITASFLASTTLFTNG